MQVKGPKGQMRYSPDLCRHIGMIAGGTGITPMLQIIRAMVKNKEDKTRIDLIYANVKEDDILLREELDGIAKNNPERFGVHYFLNEPPEGWQGGSGFVSKEAIEEKFPDPAHDIKILLCGKCKGRGGSTHSKLFLTFCPSPLLPSFPGPPPMVNAMKKHLEELKYEKPNTVSKLPDQVFCF